MKTFHERLAHAMQLRGLTRSDLASSLGLSAQAISMLLAGRNKGMSAENALATAAILGVSPDWLVTGKGEMDAGSLASGQGSGQNNQECYVLVTDATASMGRGLLQPETDLIVSTMQLSKQWIRSHLPHVSALASLAIIHAQGDSMSPTFSDGDVLLVDRGIDHIKSDAVYVIATGGELFVKRVQRLLDGKIMVKSDNPLYSPIEIAAPDRERLQILGKVVWAWAGKSM